MTHQRRGSAPVELQALYTTVPRRVSVGTAAEKRANVQRGQQIGTSVHRKKTAMLGISSDLILTTCNPSQTNTHYLSRQGSLKKMGGLPKEKSGVLFVILMAMGFDHETSYRTAAQPVRWGFGGATQKLADVIQLLITSGELADITARTKQMYKV
jgi:hypothetical protein